MVRIGYTPTNRDFHACVFASTDHFRKIGARTTLGLQLIADYLIVYPPLVPGYMLLRRVDLDVSDTGWTEEVLALGS
jgi:hypothetical protein